MIDTCICILGKWRDLRKKRCGKMNRMALQLAPRNANVQTCAYAWGSAFPLPFSNSVTMDETPMPGHVLVVGCCGSTGCCSSSLCVPLYAAGVPLWIAKIDQLSVGIGFKMSWGFVAASHFIIQQNSSRTHTLRCVHVSHIVRGTLSSPVEMQSPLFFKSLYVSIVSSVRVSLERPASAAPNCA